jgi:hypothetical protein
LEQTHAQHDTNPWIQSFGGALEQSVQNPVEPTLPSRNAENEGMGQCPVGPTQLVKKRFRLFQKHVESVPAAMELVKKVDGDLSGVRHNMGRFTGSGQGGFSIETPVPLDRLLMY